MVIYENGQYDSRYFGEDVSININQASGSPTFVTYPTVSFENSHIEFNSKFTNHWTSFGIDTIFEDSNIPSGSKVWLTIEITSVNNYYSSVTVTNSDPFPYYPDQSGDARYIYVSGGTIQGKYCVSVNDNNMIHLTIATGNEGEAKWKITKIEIDLPPITSNGGGATHIAKVTGQLKDLSSNLSDILMVSGGGGGGLLLGDSGWHGTEQNIAWSGNNNKLTVQLDDDDVLFKMYIGSSNIYSFTAPVSDISNIYLQFLIDSENEVAKPSFVYKNGSSYSFNQEEPTDSEMGDIYTWLSAGLPSE